MNVEQLEIDNENLKSENEKLRAVLDVKNVKGLQQEKEIDNLVKQLESAQGNRPEAIQIWRELDSLQNSKHYNRYRRSIRELIKFFKENESNKLLDFDITSESRSWKDQEPEDINIFTIDVKYHPYNR